MHIGTKEPSSGLNNGSRTYDTRQMVSLDFQNMRGVTHYIVESEDDGGKEWYHET